MIAKAYLVSLAIAVEGGQVCSKSNRSPPDSGRMGSAKIQVNFLGYLA